MTKFTFLLQTICLLSITNAAHISIPKVTVCEGATLIHEYKGSLPVEKLKTGDHVHIISSEITVENEEKIFPNLLHVAVEKSILKGKFEWFLKALPSVNRLVLENNNIENFNIEDLRTLHHLEILSIKDQHIGSLKSDAFSQFSKLKELRLISAEIDHIDEKAFEHAENIHILDLSRNKLRTISKEMLSPLKNLQFLILNNNQLEELTAEQIPHLPELQQIDVQDNQITNINIEDLKKKCPKLRKVLF